MVASYEHAMCTTSSKRTDTHNTRAFEKMAPSAESPRPLTFDASHVSPQFLWFRSGQFYTAAPTMGAPHLDDTTSRPWTSAAASAWIAGSRHWREGRSLEGLSHQTAASRESSICDSVLTTCEFAA